jgi:amino acid adenylation domain-containing protein
VTRPLPGDLAGAAHGYARGRGVSQSAVWRAALLTVLHRYTGRTDLAIGCGAAVLRADLSGDPSFADVVARCHGTVEAGARFRIGLARRTTDDAAAELTVAVGSTNLTAEFPAGLCDADRVDRLLDHVTVALAGGVADPDRTVIDIDILSPAERDRVLRVWNPRPVARPPGRLHDVIAGHDPDRVALRFLGTQLSYGELERRSNRLAHALIDAGIGPGHIVGLLLDRGPHLPVAQIAVMKVGAAWLPLDPQHPPARLGFLADDAGARLVLTSTDLADLAVAAAPDTPHWGLDTLVCPGPDTPPDVDVRPDDPAYLLYTSGSTGTPKGVLVPHRSAHSYCHTAVELFRITPADRVAQASNPAFDASIFDCYATLLAGAVMVSAPRETITDPASFGRLIHSERITLSYIPPAVLALLDPDDFAGSALRGIFSAGEALPPEQASRWSRPGLELHNSYGPTETTVVVTDYLCTDEPLTGPTPIGTALPNHRAYALDERLRPVPIGVTGQLYIAGTGVTYGYHRRPGLTAERFLADPYAPRPGDRMYATGDVVRWRSDGVLVFLGRRDRQVQLRGQRVELGEIEHTLTQHPDVRQCAVVLHDGGQLVAYLAGEPDVARLREYLAQRLPMYMIPTILITLPQLPLTPNGKLDAARLPDPTPASAGYVEPRTDTERWLAAVWQDLLEVERVGATDNFFDLGGSSLHATQLAARVRDHLTIALHPRCLFTNPALEQLAARLDEAETGPAGDAIAPVPRDGSLRCTHQQEGLWFLHQLDPSSAMYHIGLALRLRGDLDVPALGAAAHALVVRHEALRTRFVDDAGLPRQVIDPPPAARPLPVVDLSRDGVRVWVADQIRQPVDLAVGPLFRAALARVAPDEHVLVLVVHHIVADGWSVRILADELSILYAAGGSAALPPLRVQPADHAAWQRGWLAGPALDGEVGYWRDTLTGLSTVDFPSDRPRPAQPSGAGATVTRRLPDDLAAAARAYARTHQISFLAVLQAPLLTVLHRYTGQTDLAIGSIFSGRTRAELEPLVGFFANTVVLRTDVGGDPTFADLARRCHDTVLDAAAHQDVPFGLIVGALQPRRAAGRNPLFQIDLTLQPATLRGGRRTLGAVTAEPVPVTGDHARFDISIDVADDADGPLDLSVEYATDLFDAGRIHRLIDHYTAALAAGLDAPDTAIGDLEPLDDLDDEIAGLERQLAERTDLERRLAEKRGARPQRPLPQR